jgi:hypothetical protein
MTSLLPGLFRAAGCAGAVLELMCEKYKQQVDAGQVRCPHPAEFCRFRTACMIHFIEQENKREQRGRNREENNAETQI